MIRLVALLVVVVVAVALFLGDDGTGPPVMLRVQDVLASVEAHELVALAGGLALLVIVLPILFGGYRGRFGGAVRDLLSWSLLGFVLVAGYSYRDELGRIAFRIAGELSPPGSAVRRVPMGGPRPTARSAAENRRSPTL